MRRIRVTMGTAIMLAALAGLVTATAGCASSTAAGAAPAAPGRSAATATRVAGTAAAAPQGADQQAGIYAAVLRRYLGTPAENSFPGRAFKTVYVLSRAYADAADPNGNRGGGEPVGPQTQRQVTAALAGMAHVVFIADRGSVIETENGCEQVKNGAILITLGLPAGQAGETRVGINGFVACLGATWLTYVLREQPGTGWRVTGTTGSMSVA
jgi:hypothetical protein